MFFDDLRYSIKHWEYWIYLPWMQTKSKYRRSYLGPLWLVLSTLIFVAALTLLSTSLFNKSYKEIVPVYAIGLVLWQFIAGAINESCGIFRSAESSIRQAKIPYLSYILKSFFSQLIIFAHNFIIVVAVVLIYCDIDFLSVCISISNFMALSIFVLSITIIVSIYCTRYGDLVQVVNNFIQLMFFITPVMWERASLSNNSWLYDYNILAYFIEGVRRPLIGGGYHIAYEPFFITFATMCIACFVYTKKSKSIIYDL